MGLNKITGTVTAKIMAFTAVLFLVLLTASLIHSHLGANSLAEEFTTEQAKTIADGYMDGLNKLMLTGGMAARDEQRKQFESQPNVLEARVIRGDGINGQYGPGGPRESIQDDLDRLAMNGEEVIRITHTDKGRQLTVVRPYKATDHTRGINCLGCHAVPSGSVLGATRITYDLGPVDARIRNSGLESLGIHLALFVLGMGLLSIAFKRIVAQPVNRLSDFMSRIEQQSDLSLRVPADGRDEIARAGVALNAMMDRFARIIEQVRGATHNLARLAGQLVEVSSRTQGGVQRQLSDTEHLAAALHQLATTVREVADNTREAASAANQADGEARDGAATATHALGAISAMSRQLEQAVQVILRLDTDSRDIGRVIGLIREIAEQTNLLALNAAIEAARAGEQGRGFAVVADEVRKLAEKSAASASEIDSVTHALTERSEKVRNFISAGLSHIASSQQSMASVADVLSTAASSVTQVGHGLDDIAAATEEQRRVFTEVAKTIEAIAAMARENNLASDETAAAAQSLSELAGKLQSAVGRFKT